MFWSLGALDWIPPRGGILLVSPFRKNASMFWPRYKKSDPSHLHCSSSVRIGFVMDGDGDLFERNTYALKLYYKVSGLSLFLSLSFFGFWLNCLVTPAKLPIPA